MRRRNDVVAFPTILATLEVEDWIRAAESLDDPLVCNLRTWERWCAARTTWLQQQGYSDDAAQRLGWTSNRNGDLDD